MKKKRIFWGIGLLIGLLIIAFLVFNNMKNKDNVSFEDFNKIVKYAFENFNEYKSYSDEYPSFYVDSVHATQPGAFGSEIGDTYYFNSDGTYLWNLSNSKVLEEKVASAGKYELKDNKLILTELYTLTRVNGKTDEVSIPGGDTALGLVDYKYQVNNSNKTYSYTIKNEGVSSYKSQVNPEDTREDSYSLTDTETKYWYSIGEKYDPYFATWLNEYYSNIK